MIQKFQLGGGLFVDSVGSIVRSQQAQPISQASSKDSGILSDKLLSDLREKAIPVDMDAFINQVSKLESDLKYGFADKRAIRKLESTANRMIQQYDYLKQAETRAVSNDSLGEVAVGDRGQLFVLDESGDINQISTSEYNYEKNGPALTVNELIEHRKFNPTQTFDTSLTQTIRNNLGMSKINEYLLNIIKSVGESSTTSEAYTDLASYIGQEAAKRPSEAELQGLQTLYQTLQTLGPDAVFKTKEVTSDKNIQKAFQYIQSVLPRNIQLQLSGRYVAQGGDYKNAGSYMQGLIVDALGATNDSKREHYIDYEASINKAQEAKSESGQKRNLKNLEVLVQGSLNKVDYNITSSKNPQIGMTLHGNTVGALTNFDNNIIPKSPMSIALETSIGPLIDKNHITMGTQKINESLFDTILYDGNDVVNVWAPTDQNGDIDLNGLQQFNEILQYFDSDPSLSIQDKNNILSQYGINGYIDQNGNFVGSGNMAKFLVFTGITSDEVINKDDILANTLNKDDKKFELDQIERIYGYVNSKNKNKKANLEFKKGWFNFSTDIVKAPVFMKLKPTAATQVGTFSNHGPLINTPTYQQQVTQDQLRYNSQHSQQIYQPSTSLIFQ